MTKPLFAGGKTRQQFNEDCKHENWDTEEINVARMAGAICNMNKEAVQHATGISDSAWDRMVEKGMIEEVIHGREHFYHASAYGKQVFEVMNGSRCYNSPPDSNRHDKELCNIFSELSDTERASWKSEAQLTYEIGNKPGFKMEGCSVTDGAYISDATGEYVLVEILTKWYTEQMREAKLEFVKEFSNHYGGCTYAPTDIDAD